MPHTQTSKSQTTNRISFTDTPANFNNKSKITGNTSYMSPCLTHVPANHRQQIVHLIMPHTNNSKSQETNRLSCHASTDTSKLQAIVYLAMPHTDTNKSQATNHTSCQCLTQIPADHGGKNRSSRMIPANHRQQVVHLVMSHTITSKSQATNRSTCHASRRYQQITCSKSCFLPSFLQIPANHRQQAVHIAMRPTDTRKSETKKVHLAMSHTTQIPNP